MTEAGAAEASISAFESRIGAPGHAVDNVRLAVAGLEEAFAAGTLARTPALDSMLADLDVALDAGAGRPGAKSAEAARLIGRAIVRELRRSASAGGG